MGNTATRANNARRNLICPSTNTTDLPDDLSLECVHFQAKLIPMLIFLLLVLALPLHGCRSPDENRAPQERPNALHHPAEVSPSTLSAAARLMDGMGKVDFTITTNSKDAQAFFNQGVAQLYGFWFVEAERSFLTPLLSIQAPRWLIGELRWLHPALSSPPIKSYSHPIR